MVPLYPLSIELERRERKVRIMAKNGRGRVGVGPLRVGRRVHHGAAEVPERGLQFKPLPRTIHLCGGQFDSFVEMSADFDFSTEFL